MITVDTHALIWDALAPERQSATAQQAIAEANAGDGLLIFDISLWETAMLVEKGRVQVGVDCQSFIHLMLQSNKTRVQPITARIGTLAVQLPADISKDPADRLIVATALAENIPLLTEISPPQAAGLQPWRVGGLLPGFPCPKPGTG